jgi:hypothetical protein
VNAQSAVELKLPIPGSKTAGTVSRDPVRDAIDARPVRPGFETVRQRL